jgi:hypothetical protein
MIIKFRGQKETFLTSDMDQVKKFATEEEIKEVFTKCLGVERNHDLDIDYIIFLGRLFFVEMGDFLSNKALNDPEFNKKVEEDYNKRHKLNDIDLPF